MEDYRKVTLEGVRGAKKVTTKDFKRKMSKVNLIYSHLAWIN